MQQSASRMTRQQYVTLCEAQNVTPDPGVLSSYVELQDLPEIVQIALTIYNNLSDNYVPGDIPIFIGKDKSSLNILYEIYGVHGEMKEFVLQIINIFDSLAVEASRKKIEKLKTRGKGKAPSAIPHSRSGG